MKKMSVVSLVIAVCALVAGVTLAAETNDDISVYKGCKYCGMDRGAYNFSRMLIEYDDGTITAFCSIHCAAVDLANNIDKAPKKIQVGDFDRKHLIDAEKAFWVIGGSKPGVMSKRGKWAFEKKEDAENFMRINQGKIAFFEEAMKAAYEDMYEDTKVIRERRNQRRMKMEHHHGAGH
jgi:copper chaperone NosL